MVTIWFVLAVFVLAVGSFITGVLIRLAITWDAEPDSSEMQDKKEKEGA